MLARITFLLVLLLIGALTFAFALLRHPVFEDWRRAKAEAVLEAVLEREVFVSGTVTVDPHWDTNVQITDIAIKDASWTASDYVQKIGRVEFSTPTMPLIFGGPAELTGLVFEEGRISVEVDSEGRSNVTRASDVEDLPEPLQALTDFLRSRLAWDFSVRDMRFNYRNISNGWSTESQVETLSLKKSVDGKRLDIEGRGTFNGSPVRFVAQLDTPDTNTDKPAPSAFNLQYSVPGISAEVVGKIDLAPDIASIQATLEVISSSIGDFLETLEIERSVEGNGTFSGQLQGPLDQLALTGSEARFDIKTGESLEIKGDVGNLATGDGLALSFSGKIPEPERTDSSRGTLFNLSVTGFSGEIAGQAGNVIVKDFHLETNAFDADLQEIGPISVDKVVRDEAGRIGLEGVTVLAGPKGNPTVEVKGTITNALQLEGFSFTGRLDMPTATVLGFERDEATAGLGALQGRISFSDADGEFGIEELSARVADSSFIKLDVDLAIDDLSNLDDIAFQIGLDIPNFQKFASVLGVKVKKTGPVKFDGRIAGSVNSLSGEGSALIGKTKVDGKLKGQYSENDIKLTGSLSTPMLHISDIRNVNDVRELFEARAKEAVGDKLDLDKVKASFNVDMRLKATKIAGAGKRASNIDARFRYNDQVVRLEPLKVRYLGGQISTSVNINLKNKAPRITAKGSMSNWKIGDTLSQLGAGGTLTGTVRLNYSLNTAGSTVLGMLKSLNGRASVYLRNGTVGSTLVDLSGLSVPSWLFSRSRREGFTRLVCLVAPLTFKNGRGTVNPLVLETENVQIVGGGSFDFRKDSILIRATPRAKKRQIAAVATPFRITGQLTSPTFRLERGAGAAKVVGETLLLPLNLLGALFQSDVKDTRKNRAAPCKITKAQKAKATSKKRRK
ncbi:MAG: AsmA family protein [Hyphomicrobiales bacterium]